MLFCFDNKSILYDYVMPMIFTESLELHMYMIRQKWIEGKKSNNNRARQFPFDWTENMFFVFSFVPPILLLFDAEV